MENDQTNPNNENVEYKRMIVKVRLLLTSQELIYTNVWNTYQKGDLYCICDHETVVKIPIKHIFDIRESYSRSHDHGKSKN